MYRGYWRIGGDQLSNWPSTPTREAITANLDEIAVYPYALSREPHPRALRWPADAAAPSRTIRPTASFTSRRRNHSRASFDASTFERRRRLDHRVQLDFGDGATGTGVSARSTPTRRRHLHVTLTVTDNRGDTGSVTHTVSVTDSPPPPPDGITRPTRSHARSRTGSARPMSEVHGRWSGTASSFSVGGGVGRIAGAVSTSRAAYLSAVRQTDIDLESDVALDQPATGGGVYVSFIGRRTSNGNDYLFKLRYQAGGSVVAYLVRVVGGTETVLGSMTVPGLAVSPGDQLRVRFQVSGTTTTSLLAKVWRSGTAEPASWLLTTTDATPAALQGAGDLGVLVYVSGSWTGTLPAISLDNLDVVAPELTRHDRHEPGATAAGG